MLEVLPSPGAVAAFKVAGTLSGADYDRIIAEVETKLSLHQRIGVLMDLAEFEDITLEAAWKDIRYDLSKLSQLKRFPRLAVISDKQWMRIAAAFADAFPFLEVRHFSTAEASAALPWVAAFEPSG